jgi:hypothetical protein
MKSLLWLKGIDSKDAKVYDYNTISFANIATNLTLGIDIAAIGVVNGVLYGAVANNFE